MRSPRLIVGVLTAALALAVTSVGTTPPGDGAVRSFLQVRPASSTARGYGLSPADIASAYGLDGGGTGTVAIATAYSDPHLEADLAVYRARFGLPACTTAGGCLRIVGEDGGTNLPKADADWGEETSLDVDAVSAACPGCSILVVEASTARIDDLGTAVDSAVSLGATAVSASWGDTEWSFWSSTSARYFTHPGVPIVAATGDDGATTAVFPAALPNVIAVGGTTLTSTTDGTGSPATVQQVQGGAVTTTTTSATVTKDRQTLAKAKSALGTAKRRVTAAAASLHRATVRRAHAATARSRTLWRHRVSSLTRALASARKTEKTAAKRVSGAESVLLKDLVREQSEQAAVRAKLGQTGRAGWIETAWSGGGSGCSAFVPRPSWQPRAVCARRSTADLAADADPQSGLATYDTYGTSADTPDGWLVAGGTSLAAPLVAAMLVRSGHAASYSSAQPLYAHAGAFWDVTGGANGSCRTALCDAGVGYDGPTGLGSPRSLASF